MILNADALHLPIDGRFKKGEHRSPSTEFKKGEHWREHKPYWEKEWLEKEYIVNQRSANEIAKQFDITESAILFWLRKHKIPARSMGDIRSIKHWGLSGEKNGMFGKRGSETPGWKGGCSPERQQFYCSREWIKASSYVWKRDGGRCKRCGERNSKVHIHHIISFRIINLRSDPNNLVLLCVKCHRFVHSKKNINKEFIGEEVRNDS